MRSRSRSVTVEESYRAGAKPTDWGYLRTTMSITEVSGTSSPSRNHHFDSHMWQVVKVRSRSLTDIDRDQIALLALGAGPGGGLRHRASSGGCRGSREHSTGPSSLESAVRWLPHPPKARVAAATGDARPGLMAEGVRPRAGQSQTA